MVAEKNLLSMDYKLFVKNPEAYVANIPIVEYSIAAPYLPFGITNLSTKYINVTVKNENEGDDDQCGLRAFNAVCGTALTTSDC